MARDSAVSIDPEEILKAYTLGYFPMARAHDDPHAVWVLPEERGVLTFDQTRLPGKLRRFVAKDPFLVTANVNFAGVIGECAALSKGPGVKVQAERSETWINDQIREVYLELHRLGFAHSVECWEGDRLVGGLYGLALGRTFFGESMFSRQTNASKVAFTHLIGRLKIAGFSLIDTQFYTPHLGQFGVCEVSNETYQDMLSDGLCGEVPFPVTDNYSSEFSTSCVLQSITQTS